VTTAPSTAPSSAHAGLVRVRVKRKRSRRFRRRMRRLGIALAVLLVVGFAWLVVRGLQARHDLIAAESSIGQVRGDLLAGNSAGAAQALAGTQIQTADADRATHDFVWSIAGAIPFVGRPAHTTSEVTSIARRLADQTFPQLVQTAGVVSSERIEIAHGSINLTVLAAQATPLRTADAAVAADLDHLQRLAGSWLGPVSRGRSALLTQLTPLAGEVHAAAVTASIGPAMLGAEGPRNYFVAFQNDAEARGTGGIPGAYVILHASDGHLTVTARGSDVSLSDTLPPVQVSTAFARTYNPSGSDHIWRNANEGADFATAGHIWSTLWQEQTGQRLDGSFAVDPNVLAYLLAATGPTTLSTGQTVDAANAVQLTESTTYATFGTSNGSRKSFLQLVSSATIDHVLAAPSSAGPAILQALRTAAGEHRLLVYSTAGSEERRLVTTDVGGALPPTTAPTAILTLVNASGNKIDYYVSTALKYSAQSCSGRTRTVTVSIKIHDGAPKSGLPSYVTARLDGGSGPPGSEVSLVSYYGTGGAQVLSATLDGRTTTVNASSDDGHPVFSDSLTLLPGATNELVMYLREPVLAGPVQTRPQPLVRPQAVNVEAPVCRD
jgi:hypothetical protein